MKKKMDEVLQSRESTVSQFYHVTQLYYFLVLAGAGAGAGVGFSDVLALEVKQHPLPPPLRASFPQTTAVHQRVNASGKPDQGGRRSK